MGYHLGSSSKTANERRLTIAQGVDGLEGLFLLELRFPPASGGSQELRNSETKNMEREKFECDI